MVDEKELFETIGGLLDLCNLYAANNLTLLEEVKGLHDENKMLRNMNRNLVRTGQKMAGELREARAGKTPQVQTVDRDFFFCPNISQGEN